MPIKSPAEVRGGVLILILETPLPGSRRASIVGPDRLPRPLLISIFTQVPTCLTSGRSSVVCSRCKLLGRRLLGSLAKQCVSKPLLGARLADMSKELVNDELWRFVEPLLPVEASKARGGRPRIPDRAVLSGIVFVLKSGIPWRMLPKEMGFGSGITCWRRFREWQKAGVWRRLHRTLLDWLGRSGRVDWSRACVDSASVPAKRGAKRSDPTPPTGVSLAPSTTS
jgi:transposase